MSDIKTKKSRYKDELHIVKPRLDLTGQTFGDLKVLGLSDRMGSRGSRMVPLWECECKCGSITYKATDTLRNHHISMCSDCAGKYTAESARKAAGYADGTQITKIRDMTLPAANTSGVRGVYYDKRTNKWRARLKFKGKLMNFGSFIRFEDAVHARKTAEQEYYGSYLEENVSSSADEQIKKPSLDKLVAGAETIQAAQTVSHSQNKTFQRIAEGR